MLKGSGIAAAIDYSLNHWDALTENLNKGNVAVDNNHCENQMRSWAMGRKAWLFAGSELAGQRAAVVMSLVASAKLNGHDALGVSQGRARAVADATQQPYRRVASAPLETTGLNWTIAVAATSRCRAQTYMNAPKFARPSIHVGSKVKIASVYPDFGCSFWLLSLMEFAG